MALLARGKKSYLDAVVAFYLRYPSETAATENAFASVAERPEPVVPVRRRAASFSGRPSAPEPVSGPAPKLGRARSTSTWRIELQHGRSGSMSDGKVDWCIFVLSPDDVLFAGGYRMGEFHHSSFLAGDKIKAAGQICVIDGKLVGITPKSGHYHPGPDELCTMLKFLAERRVDLSTVEVWYPVYGQADPESKPFLIMADEFLRIGGQFDKRTTSCVPFFILGGGRPNPEMMRLMAAALTQRV